MVKKLFSLCLLTAMLLTAAGAGAVDTYETEDYVEEAAEVSAGYSDIEGSGYENTVEEISGFGIMTGYPDGTFRVKENITRAEFAVILTRLTAVDHIVKTMAPKAVFSDVSEKHWAAREIQIISEKRYIEGAGNGMFFPEKPITGAEAVKLLVNALGYGEKAEKKGGWTIGYLAVGAELGIVADTSFSDKPLTRGMAAEMLVKALKTSNSDGKTLLSLLNEKIFYVSPDGSDSNPGTEDKPWKTLKKAANTMQAGSTAIFEDGVYIEDNVTTFRYNGKEGAPITIKARNKHGAVIKYSKVLRLTTKLRIAQEQSYINIRDFHFTQEETAKESDAGKTSDILLRCEGSYCEITGNKCTNVYEEGIKLGRARHVLVEDNIVIGAIHEGVDLMVCSNCIIRNNQFLESGRVGIMIKGNTNNTLVYNNIVRNDVTKMMIAGVTIGGSSNGNLIHAKDVGYQLYSSMFYNNVVVSGKEGLIPIAYYFMGTRNSYAFNNVAVGADLGIGLVNSDGLNTGWEWNPINLNPVVKNNIIANCYEGIKFVDEPVNPTIENNIFYKVETGNKLGGFIADPGFVDVMSDWHTKAGSPVAGGGAEIPTEITSCFDGTIVKVDAVDFDMNPREGVWDIGIYNAE